MTDLNQPRQQTLHSNNDMTRHHPDERWLTEYVAGSLSESQALCVSTHLSYCASCSAEVAKLNRIGAMVFDNQPPSASVDHTMFDRIMSRIESRDIDFEHDELRPSLDPARPVSGVERLPSAISKLVPGGMDQLRWKKLGKYLRVAGLHSLDDQRDVSLHKLMPGGTVAEHDHQGEEITVVLCGSFSDQDGVYRAGDFIVRQPGDTHRPIVTGEEECICLAVCDAPVKFTGMFARLLNPLVAYQHKH